MRRVGQILVTIFALTFALFPILWIISAAFNPTSSMANQTFIPPNASTANFDSLLRDPLHPFFLWMWNSVKVATITSTLAVFVTALTAYAFSRFRFRGRRSLLLSILLIQVFPNLLTMVALFLFLRQIGEYFPPLGLNSHGGLIMVYLGAQMGINIWLMKGYFDTIPRDIDESAAVDGATHWQTFWMLIFPLVRPVLAVVGVLAFVGTFNEFVLSNVLLRSTEQFTLMVGLYLFVTENFAQQWGVFAAGAILGAVPTLVLYMILQDYIVSGLTTGAVKG
jgi:ABC-type maltose transport system permease subunit